MLLMLLDAVDLAVAVAFDFKGLWHHWETLIRLSKIMFTVVWLRCLDQLDV